MTSNNGEESISYRFLLLQKWLLKKALVQPISAWLCFRDSYLPPPPPPIASFPFVFTEKDYDAISGVLYNLCACDFVLQNGNSFSTILDSSKHRSFILSYPSSLYYSSQVKTYFGSRGINTSSESYGEEIIVLYYSLNKMSWYDTCLYF